MTAIGLLVHKVLREEREGGSYVIMLCSGNKISYGRGTKCKMN